jgi:hypothetical protein
MHLINLLLIISITLKIKKKKLIVNLLFEISTLPVFF